MAISWISDFSHLQMEILYKFSGWIVGLVIMACATGQTLPQQQTQVPINFLTATVDGFGHVYYANSENEVIKINANHQRLGYFSNNRLGDVGYIDVTNPLKVLVFYPDFYTVVVLDRQLNETGRFDLVTMGYGQIESVGASRDGTLWLFDDHAQRLIKVDQQGEVLQQGEDLRLRFNERIKPSKIKEFGKRIFLNVPTSGILIFDLFGQYSTKVDAKHIDDFQCTEDQIIFFRSGKIEIYHLTDYLSRYLDVPKQEGKIKYLMYGSKLISVTPEHIEWLDLQ